jgi:hypothetical protein
VKPKGKPSGFDLDSSRFADKSTNSNLKILLPGLLRNVTFGFSDLKRAAATNLSNYG